MNAVRFGFGIGCIFGAFLLIFHEPPMTQNEAIALAAVLVGIGAGFLWSTVADALKDDSKEST